MGHVTPLLQRFKKQYYVNTMPRNGKLAKARESDNLANTKTSLRIYTVNQNL